jgi:hypothetical protein
MKNVIMVALGLAAAAPLSATEYLFNDLTYRAVDSSGTDWSSLNVELGKFAAGFTPTSANLDLWGANWIPFADPMYSPSGYFAAGPEWQALISLPDNSQYAVGDTLFLWAFDSLVGAGREWALLTDASWSVVANDILDPVMQEFAFTSQTTALFGAIQHQRNDPLVMTAQAVAVPVPEPSTWAGVIGGVVLTLFAARRRRRT